MFKPQMQVQSRFGEPQSPKQPGVFWGMGWGLEQAEGVDTFWHWGHEETAASRVRFAEDGSKLVLLQDDGEENESARTPSAPPPQP